MIIIGRKKNYDQRTRIIKAAYEEFVQHGYDQVPLHQIAAHCEMSASLVQHYFPKKEDIVIGVFYDLLAKVSDYMEDILPPQQGNEFRCGFFYCLFYEVLVHHDGLINIYSTISSNSRLLGKATANVISKPKRILKNATPNENLGLYILNGTLSQIMQLYLDGALEYTLRDAVCVSLRVYYKFIGFRDSQIRQVFNEIEELLTDEVIDTFIDHYVASMQ